MEKKGTLKTPQTPQTPQTPETPKTPETPGTPKTPDTYHHSIFLGQEWTHIEPLMGRLVNLVVCWETRKCMEISIHRN